MSERDFLAAERRSTIALVVIGLLQVAIFLGACRHVAPAGSVACSAVHVDGGVALVECR